MIDLEDLDMSRPAGPVAPEGDAGWQPLPQRARTLFILSGVLGMLVPLAAVAGAGGWMLLRAGGAPWIPALAALFLIALGAWLGNKKFRYTHWLLDDDGFALRRGRLWRSETRIPGSRVQHLDIRRGPLERQFGLSTLLVHTAGTRQHAVAVPGLDSGDAERLRDHLARQVEHDDDEP